MDKKHLGHVLFHDSKGNAIGIGETIEFTKQLPKIPGGRIGQAITVSNGAVSEITSPIDEATVDKLRKGQRKLSDMKLKKMANPSK